MRITSSINYGSTHNNLFDDSSVLPNALTLPPTAPPLFGENGELNWQVVSLYDGTLDWATWTNPLSSLRRTHNTSSGNLIANSVLTYQVLPNLDVKVNAGFSRTDSEERMLNPISSQPPTMVTSTTTGSAVFGNNGRRSWLFEPQVQYMKNFGNHGLNIIAGLTWQESITSFQKILATGYTSDALINSTAGATDVVHQVDDYSQYRYNALFARLGYDFKDRIFVDLTARRDGSSRFGPDNRFGNFGAVGIGWVFSSEPFMQGLNFMSFGKIRGSWGTSGNDQIGDYQYLDTYRVSSGFYQNGISLYPDALFNPELAWEITTKLEGALELGFFDDRILLEPSWYRNRSSNQLVSYPLPATSGFNSITYNFDAIIENSGLELLVTSKNLNGENFQWTTTFNISFQRNKLVQFDGIENSPYATQYKVGHPLSIQRLYTWTGVDPETGEHTFLDVNGDGTLDDDDKSFMKPITRDFFGGLVNTIDYRGFELSFLFQFVRQNARKYATGYPGGFGNQPVSVLERWSQPGDITNVQRFNSDYSLSDKVSYAASSDYGIEDASFIRLKTFTLAYAFPSRLLEKVKLSGMRLFVQGQNLLTLTDYENFDPETGSSLPPLKILSAGVQFKL